jgi:hypothetical protein
MFIIRYYANYDFCWISLNIINTVSSTVPGGYKYGNLALQVGGVSDETEKYSREFCGTSAHE